MNFKGRLKYEKQNQKYTLAWPQCWSISGHGWNGSTLANSGFCLDFKYQGGVKCTVSGVFTISEGYKQNWSFPGSALLAVSV